ncbi:MAG: hypothetical protein Q4P14_02515 [Methanobacteriaceae archaeon]|nr:hypothetical protein [Methanobacteriaceae archaeon]
MLNKTKQEEEIEELKEQLSRYRKENRLLKERCESYEDRIQRFAIEREKLSIAVTEFQTLDLELKQYNLEELTQETYKLEHRVDVLRSYLRAERGDNEHLNSVVNSLTKQLNEANNEIARLNKEFNKLRIRKNQRTFFLENRLDIAYGKIAELRYTLDEYEKLGFWKRVRGKAPDSLED